MSDIKKINGKYYDFETKNESFLKTAAELKALGVKNYYFMLEIINPFSGVADMDPFNPKVNVMQIDAMMREAHSNMWYFIREIVRIPIQGGSSVPYSLHRALAAQIWLFKMHYDSCLCISRQCYKTSGILAGPIQWAYLVGTTNSAIHFFGKNSENTKKNLNDLKSFIEVLPKWIQFQRRIDDGGKEKRSKMNATELKNVATNNTISISAEARSREIAQSMARGKSVPIIYHDELEFTPYSDVIISNSAPAYKTAADNAKANGAPYGRIFTSTPGDLDTPTGRAANAVIQTMIPWSEKLYDYSIEQIEEYIEASQEQFKNSDIQTDREPIKIFYIEYQWYQIRRTREWLKEIIQSIGDKSTIRREIFLQRLRGSSESPIDQEDLDYLIENMKKPTNDIMLINKYRMILYSHGQAYPDINIFDPKIPYLIGIDCAAGGGGDYTSMTVINPYNLQIAAEFRSKYIGPTDQFRAVMDLIVNYIPRSVIIPERNGPGIALIELVLESKIRDNLYYHESDDMVKMLAEESPEDYELRNAALEKKKYGTYVGRTTRELLFEVLFQYVAEYKQVLNGEYLVDGLCKLVTKKTPSGLSRVQHAVGEHDDCVFSWMHAVFVYEYGDNLHRFGIHKDPTKHVLFGDIEIPTEDIDFGGENTNDFHAGAITFESIYREDSIMTEQLIKYAVSVNKNIRYAGYDPSKDLDDTIDIPPAMFDQFNNF